MTESEKTRIKLIEEYENEIEAIDPADVAVDGIGYHQALHASYICLDNVDRHLLNDAVILSDPEFFALAEKAHEALFELYQKFGEKLSTGER